MFRILSKANAEQVAALARPLVQKHELTLLKEPGKTLVMIQLREPVRQSLFYIGEVLAAEAIVELAGVKGMAVVMGDDMEKALHMAVIDAAVNKGVFGDEKILLEMEAEQLLQVQRENALHLKTVVQFTSMDQEAAR